MNEFASFWESLRPRQWTKNLILFAGVIFAQKLGDPVCLLRAGLGALVFCFVSGAVYLFNDIADVEQDRLHPYKRLRPIASRRLSIPAAVRGGLVLVAGCLVAAWLLGPPFLAAVLVFFLWNILYTRVLKRIRILDVVGIGVSFMIRAVAGVLVLSPRCPDVTISPWLLLCTFFLSLFLGFAKRRDELVKMAGTVQNSTRPVLNRYSEPLLNALIGTSFGLTLMTYALYTVWPSTVAHFGTRNLVFTLPFVLVGMARYLYLIFREGRGGRPHEILLNDLFLQTMVIGWIATAVLIIGTGQATA
jgi:4-hydroxybenzoate polyprenyltransferase